MTTLQQLADGQVNPEIVVNENFETVGHVGIFGKRHAATSGLTWGYYGGRLDGTMVADGAVTLADGAANHVVVERATGVVSVATATTNWSDTTTYGRLYKVTTAAGAVSAVEDHRVGAAGVLATGGASAVTSVAGRTGAVTLAAADIPDLGAAITAQLGAADVLVFKGVIDCSSNPNYPAADAGHLYKISQAGRIGGAAGRVVAQGDTVYCVADGTVAGTHTAVGASWQHAPADDSVGSGSVTSVALSMPGVIFDATVPGSPVTGAGTLTPTLKTQTANTVLAGPTTGSAATPTMRALVAADLPSAPSIASPSWSSSMTLDLSTIKNGGIIRITLGGNTTLGVSNGTDGQRFILELTQDATGSRTVTFGSSFRFGTSVTSFTATTTAAKLDRVGCVYHGTAAKADIVAVAQGF